MSIKPITEIPLNTVDKRRSYRDMIRQDIQTAIDQRITKSEPDWFGWLKQRDCLRDECWKYQCDTCVFADEPEEDDE